MRSFPRNAWAMPGSERMVLRSCGLQAKRTTVPERAPWRFFATRISREGENWEREARIFWADSGRFTQAMKCLGIWVGKGGSSELMENSDVSRRDRIIPERIAMPSVPVQRCM